MITGTYVSLPENIYTVTKGTVYIGFVRATDAMEAYRKGTVIFGKIDGVTSILNVRDTEVSE